MNPVLNAFIYFFGWLWCVLWGAHQNTLLPVLYVLILVPLQLFLVYYKTPKEYPIDLAFVISLTLLGFFLEMTFLRFGVLSYATQNSISSTFPPLWILALYPLFAMTLNHSLKPIFGNPIISLIFGCVGGPLAYYLGSKLGAVFIHSDFPFAYPLISFCWGALLFFASLQYMKIRRS